MKKVYINYADQIFKKEQNFALRAAKYRGKFDVVIGASPKNIDEKFHKEYSHILNEKRGGGYWLWKPYLIKKTLASLEYGDYLFYSDSGAYFLKKIDILISVLNSSGQDIMGFEMPLIEGQWTKKELFVNMDCVDEIFSESNQIMASFILIKRTNQSDKFFSEFLKYSCNEINITDKFIENVKQNNDFIDHRHDQSIFSLLYKKYNLKPFKDPSQLGNLPAQYISPLIEDIDLSGSINQLHGKKFRIKKYPETYNNILLHYRGSGKPIKSFFVYYLKIYYPKVYKAISNLEKKT